MGGDVPFVDVLIKNWIPTTLGNFVSGAFIVALSYSFFFGRLGNKEVNESAKFAEGARKSMGIEEQKSEAAVEPDNMEKDVAAGEPDKVKEDVAAGEPNKE